MFGSVFVASHFGRLLAAQNTHVSAFPSPCHLRTNKNCKAQCASKAEYQIQSHCHGTSSSMKIAHSAPISHGTTTKEAETESVFYVVSLLAVVGPMVERMVTHRRCKFFGEIRTARRAQHTKHKNRKVTDSMARFTTKRIDQYPMKAEPHAHCVAKFIHKIPIYRPSMDSSCLNNTEEHFVAHTMSSPLDTIEHEFKWRKHLTIAIFSFAPGVSNSSDTVNECESGKVEI